jgi:hypothetical protein
MYLCKGCQWDAAAGSFQDCDWVGGKCATAPCKVSRNPCQNRGVCEEAGLCRCFAGFAGPDCGETTQLQRAVKVCDPENLLACAANGVCHSGECWCYPGFTGEDCSEVARADEMVCVHEPWTEWSACISSERPTMWGPPCGSGKRYRHRDARDGCGERETEDLQCENRPCCDVNFWTQWSSCAGCSLRSRLRTFVSAGAATEPSCFRVPLTEDKDCSSECAESCNLGDWVPAGSCSATCGIASSCNHKCPKR